jgi:hypothetical protein|tara:strand:+ start:1203 stop:1391 length:189 start_codon:yes stop_codon:yes gene_type:complete
MAKSIKDLYDNSDKSKYPIGTGLDKTPTSDGYENKLHKDDKALEQARGGKLNQKKYSDNITY